MKKIALVVLGWLSSVGVIVVLYWVGLMLGIVDYAATNGSYSIIVKVVIILTALGYHSIYRNTITKKI